MFVSVCLFVHSLKIFTHNLSEFLLILRKVGVDGLTYAGCHGLKIIHPDGQRYIHHVEQEYKERLLGLEEDLRDTVERNGAWVEHKDLLVIDSVFLQF